jgi:transposase InsO family protein
VSTGGGPHERNTPGWAATVYETVRYSLETNLFLNHRVGHDPPDPPCSSSHAVKFLQSIIYRFGVPKWVLTDNGTQFKGAKFTRCCTDFGIHHQASLAAHPQTNGQVK